MATVCESEDTMAIKVQSEEIQCATPGRISQNISTLTLSHPFLGKSVLRIDRMKGDLSVADYTLFQNDDGSHSLEISDNRPDAERNLSTNGKVALSNFSCKLNPR
jgi:hypothetical protein